MTHDQIIGHLNAAMEGLGALSQVTYERQGPPIGNPRHHLARAAYNLEDAILRVGAAGDLERAYAAQGKRT